MGVVLKERIQQSGDRRGLLGWTGEGVLVVEMAEPSVAGILNALFRSLAKAFVSMPFLKSQPLEGRVLERGYVGKNRLIAGTLERMQRRSRWAPRKSTLEKVKRGAHLAHAYSEVVALRAKTEVEPL